MTTSFESLEVDGPAVAAHTLVRMSGMSKAFGATQALRDGSLELVAGEVHAIVGENGSGKSTLVKLLGGVHRPDAGRIELAGEALTEIPSPRTALAHGIGTVFQEILGLGPRSVLENLWSGADGLVRNRVPLAEKRDRGQAMVRELLGRELDLDAPLELLSLSDRQTCAIARTLLRRPRVLVLDEATSALDVETRDRLFGVVRGLCADGVGVVLISHRMDEIEEIADRLTVMRNGTTVASLSRGAWTPQMLVRLMTGAEELTDGTRDAVAPVARRTGPVVLRTDGLRLRPEGEAIDIAIRAGEIIGLAGLEGHGQDRFLQALWAAPTAATGAIWRVDGDEEVLLRSPRHAARHGVAYVPRDRRTESLFGSMSIRENFAMPTLARDRRGALLWPGRSRRRLEGYVDDLNIVLGDTRDAITTLSGGNQQKVVLARWLASGPRVLLLNDPTRGVDVNAKRDLYELLADLANNGLAVVMLSTEVDEHIELMDRVLVFREGNVSREIERASLSREALVASFFGAREDGDA